MKIEKNIRLALADEKMAEFRFWHDRHLLSLESQEDLTSPYISRSSFHSAKWCAKWARDCLRLIEVDKRSPECGRVRGF